jgi:hypothetical protein
VFSDLIPTAPAPTANHHQHRAASQSRSPWSGSPSVLASRVGRATKPCTRGTLSLPCPLEIPGRKRCPRGTSTRRGRATSTLSIARGNCQCHAETEAHSVTFASTRGSIRSSTESKPADSGMGQGWSEGVVSTMCSSTNVSFLSSVVQGVQQHG